MKIKSREYKIFREEEILEPETLYEKACLFSSKIIGMKSSNKKLKDAIDFSHMRISSNDVISFAVLFALLTFLPITILMILNNYYFNFGFEFGYYLLSLVLAAVFTYYVYSYPFRVKKRYEMEAGSDIVIMILYMAMHMRNMPNLERALKFAAKNVSGALGHDLKKLVWDIDVGNYLTVEEALTDYSRKWMKSREFIQAIELLIASLDQTEDRRISMLNEAMNVILEGNRENAKHFNQKLKMPIMMVHALGLILPLLGLVLFPLVAIFLHVGTASLFIVYDIILPIILFFMISNILESRPSTFSRIETETDILAKRPTLFQRMPAWPFAITLSAILIAIGFLITEEILSALLITSGIAFGIALYYYLQSFQNMKLREDINEIESEFSLALFQLGNSIHSGIPIELSVERLIKRSENLKIKNLFIKTLNNMKNLGMTFRQAIFDNEYGSVWLYPSRLIKTVMRTVVESAERGSMAASTAMLSVARYIKGLHQTQEEVKEQLNDPLNSMKFQAFVLSPLVSGIVTTLAIVVMGIMQGLYGKITDLPSFFQSWSEIDITNFQFIFVVAVYLIETCIILSIFINGIENGEDDIGRKNTIAKILSLGFMIFIITLSITLMILLPLTTAIL